MNLKTIKRITGVSVETAPFRKTMYYHFQDSDWNYQDTISDIKVKMYLNKYVMTVRTHRPGILIGKAGRFIDGLQKRLTEEHEFLVEIKIVEDKMWLDFHQKT